MAQGLGQFTGLTHATRVDDAEETLREAVATFHEYPVEERTRRAKGLAKMAARVLRARLQYLKAEMAAARRIPTAEALAKRAMQLEHLQTAHEAAVAGGVDAIHREFGMPEATRNEP